MTHLTLGGIDARKAHVFESCFFGALNFDETAEALKVSAAKSQATGAPYGRLAAPRDESGIF